MVGFTGAYLDYSSFQEHTAGSNLKDGEDDFLQTLGKRLMKGIYFHCKPGHIHCELGHAVYHRELTNDLRKFTMLEIIEEMLSTINIILISTGQMDLFVGKKSTLSNTIACSEGQSIPLQVLLPPRNYWTIKFIFSVAIGLHAVAWVKENTWPRNTEKG